MFYNFLSEKYYYESEYDQAFGVRHQGIWGAQQFLTARKISVRKNPWLFPQQQARVL